MNRDDPEYLAHVKEVAAQLGPLTDEERTFVATLVAPHRRPRPTETAATK